MNKSTGIALSFLLVLALVVGVINISPVFAQDQAQEPNNGGMARFIRVLGSGSSTARPDTAVIFIGVRTEGEEASAALDDNNSQVNELISTLSQAGIERADIQTQRINLYPRYSERPNQAGQPVVTGYEATNTVRVRVRDIDQVGELLDTSVQAGSNLIENIQFEVSNTEEAMEQARQAAFQNARQKAEQLARLAGVQLGSIISISESASWPVMPFAAGGRAEAADMAVPVEPGTQDIVLHLEVTWSITGGQAEASVIPETGTEATATQALGSPTPADETATPRAATSTPAAATATPSNRGLATATPEQPGAGTTGFGPADQLAEQGADVRLQGTIDQPFFPVTGRLLVVNGEQVQAFVFNNEADALAAADTITATGQQAGFRLSDLIGANVYHRGDAIVLYFGNNQAVLNLLAQTFGSSLTD